ncbi:hypothetical protein DPMN_069833 [Dreissena polymorpha]|uniref:Uncharacterized protein n=1 Tax=Dreissena polymorpha TaxID=45954 RepID=A0A9D4BNF8_DREPO|nr:hypothetical protein DPMN_069833 [Dreissena polymorpha]
MKSFPQQKDTQDNLCVTRPVKGEPDRPPVHHEEVSSLSSGCASSIKRGEDFGCRPNKTEAEEELDRR